MLAARTLLWKPRWVNWASLCLGPLVYTGQGSVLHHFHALLFLFSTGILLELLPLLCFFRKPRDLPCKASARLFVKLTQAPTDMDKVANAKDYSKMAALIISFGAPFFEGVVFVSSYSL
ncbi:hypothetical protein J1N35_028536 [Gossypium stocksii]|uniref:Uncharacterized protein n=1 Tax=Gossypium stocksii TaxID=47602 RepID=A0A9D3ZS28_9ROSI|nr:hypothetical protein J1N35_028536 [Gossypium stocksii]